MGPAPPPSTPHPQLGFPRPPQGWGSASSVRAGPPLCFRQPVPGTSINWPPRIPKSLSCKEWSLRRNYALFPEVISGFFFLNCFWLVWDFWKLSWVTRNWALGPPSAGLQSGNFHDRWAWSLDEHAVQQRQRVNYTEAGSLRWEGTPLATNPATYSSEKEKGPRRRAVCWVQLLVSDRDSASSLISCLLVPVPLQSLCLWAHRHSPGLALRWEGCQEAGRRLWGSAWRKAFSGRGLLLAQFWPGYRHSPCPLPGQFKNQIFWGLERSGGFLPCCCSACVLHVGWARSQWGALAWKGLSKTSQRFLSTLRIRLIATRSHKMGLEFSVGWWIKSDLRVDFMGS